MTFTMEEACNIMDNRLNKYINLYDKYIELEKNLSQIIDDIDDIDDNDKITLIQEQITLIQRQMNIGHIDSIFKNFRIKFFKYIFDDHLTSNSSRLLDFLTNPLFVCFVFPYQSDLVIMDFNTINKIDYFRSLVSGEWKDKPFIMKYYYSMNGKYEEICPIYVCRNEMESIIVKNRENNDENLLNIYGY